VGIEQDRFFCGRNPLQWIVGQKIRKPAMEEAHVLLNYEYVVPGQQN